MKIDNKYRILFDNEHLPEEIEQNTLNNTLSVIQTLAQNLCDMILYAQNNNSTTMKILDEIFQKMNLTSDTQMGQLKELIYHIEQMQQSLAENNDLIPSYEESENICDHGYAEEWIGSGIFERVIEDTDNYRITEEVFCLNGNFVHRKCTIKWELQSYNKHSQEIQYEDLPIDEELIRLLNNSLPFMKNITTKSITE